MRWRWSGLALLSACGCPPLSEVSATGEPASVRQTVERALRDFEGWVDRDLCLARVRVGRVGGDRGRYNTAAHGIRIDPDHPDPRLATLHELCHGLDVQHGLSDDHQALFAAAAAEERPNQRRQSREGFAEVCANGLTTLRLATDRACLEGDVDQAWFLARDLAYQEDLGSPMVELVPLGSWTPPGAPPDAVLAGCGATADGRIALSLVGLPQDTWIEAVDPATGAVSDVATDEVQFAETVFGDVPAPEGWFATQRVEVDEGPVLRAQLAVDGQPYITRFLSRRDGTWSTVDTCAMTRACLFELEGRAMLGVWEGDRFTWSVFD